MSFSLTLKHRTFLANGVAAVLAAVIGVFSLYTLEGVVQSERRDVIVHAQQLIDVESLETVAERVSVLARGYVISRDTGLLNDMDAANTKVVSSLRELREQVRDPHENALISGVEDAEREYADALKRLTEAPDKGAVRADIAASELLNAFNYGLRPARKSLEESIDRLWSFQESAFEQAKTETAGKVHRSILLLGLVVASLVLLSLLVTHSLNRVVNQQYERLQETLRMREEMSAIVSHDLKNPLTAILANVQLLQRSSPAVAEDPIAGKSLKTISHAASSMYRLVSDLLELARIESGKLPLERKSHTLQAATAPALEMATPIAREKSIAIRARLPHPQARVDCDIDRMTQVLSNLLGNAIKFSPEGSEVTLEADAADGGATFQVLDSGPGVPESALPYIFDRFRQARAEDRKTGTGLGLAIAKGIVEAHGGTIRVENRSGAGAAFSFIIPSRSA